jgi:hypothetical protein
VTRDQAATLLAYVDARMAEARAVHSSDGGFSEAREARRLRERLLAACDDAPEVRQRDVSIPYYR